MARTLLSMTKCEPDPAWPVILIIPLRFSSANVSAPLSSISSKLYSTADLYRFFSSVWTKISWDKEDDIINEKINIIFIAN